MQTLLLGPTDPAYPAALRALDPPPDLRLRGALPARPGVAVVGTRHPSEAALAYARALSADLARAGLAVWSGGAHGIDQAAHEGALDAGGVTVLAAGGGLDRPYPPGVEGLWARILAGGGALAAVVDDGDPPMQPHFFKRNSVLAAATLATVLVECPIRSGARNTTSAARKLGRPVWVVAHPPWTSACPAVREELRLGARLLLHVDDLVASIAAPLLPLGEPRPAPAPPQPPDADPDPLLAALARGPRHPDQLCAELGRPYPELSAALLELCLDGRAREVGPGLFEKVTR